MKAGDLLRLGELFDSLQWPTDGAENTPFPNLFERYCRMWNRLDPPQRDLILELTKSYLWIRSSATEELFLAAWRASLVHLPTNSTVVALAPLPKKPDAVPKSFDYLHYIAHGCEFNLRQTVGKRALKFCSFSDLASLADDPNATIVLVDDYLGSGDTAVKALTSLRTKHPGLNSNKTIILAIAAQSQAVAHIQNHNCSVVAARILNRGISDNKGIQNATSALATMTQLESRLKLKKDYRLGYKATEALVTLTRTPNNTFPVYWTNKQVDGSDWEPPFPR